MWGGRAFLQSEALCPWQELAVRLGHKIEAAGRPPFPCVLGEGRMCGLFPRLLDNCLVSFWFKYPSKWTS